MADTFFKLMKGNNPQTQEVKLFPIGKTKRHGDKFNILVSSEQGQGEDVKINQLEKFRLPACE